MSSRWGIAWFGIAWFGLAVGCTGRLDVDPGPNLGIPDASRPDGGRGGCTTTPEQMFADQVYPQIFGTTCIACHSATGPASATRLVLVPLASSPDALRTNFETVRTVAAIRLFDQGNRSLLELKPTAIVPHGGATALPPGGALHQLLRDFIDRLDGAPCDPSVPPPLDYPFYTDVTYVEPLDLLRRVTLNLNARLPTDAERAAVEAGGLTALGPIVDTILDDPRFVARVEEVFDDIFLTRGHTESGGALLAYDNYDASRNWVESLYSPPESYAIGRDYDEALRREPVELVGYIVAHDRPITEIVTADYTVVSPYTARGYGVFDAVRGGFSNENDPFEFIQTRLPPLRSRAGQVQSSATGFYPHAGVLTTPQFLVRYPSTDTNRDRGRARQFFQIFLGYDIMASAPAVTDTAAVTAMFPDPTMPPTLVAPDCVACHRTIDPVAGLFQQYDNRGDFQFRTTPWYTDMFAPGYAMTSLPAAELDRSLAWLGAQAAADGRFPVAMAEYAYYLLTQERVMRPPSPGDDIAQSMRRGYDAQRAAIDDAARALVAADFDFKAAVRSLVFSDFYRASGVTGAVTDPRRTAELDVLGASALYTPEQLVRNTQAIFGFDLGLDRRQPTDTPYLLYGGLDFAQVTQRPSLPSGAMGALMRLHANRIACTHALRELWAGPQGPYPLFPHVDATTVDETRVRQNLVHLHDLLLGQRLTPSSPEIDRSYGLFTTVVREGAARVAAGTEDPMVSYECRDQPVDATVPDDRAYVMRGWQAVLTYLLRRPEYLLQQ